jgi:hypothetical protein
MERKSWIGFVLAIAALLAISQLLAGCFAVPGGLHLPY